VKAAREISRHRALGFDEEKGRAVENRLRRQIGLAISWLVFPLVPVVLEDMYYQGLINPSPEGRPIGRPDPRDWDWLTWVIELGPLLGFAFLAGATLDLPDHPGAMRPGLRRLLSRRSVWVAVGPWWGFLAWAGVFFGFLFLLNHFPLLQGPSPLESWQGTWTYWILSWALGILFVGTFAYGWLWTAWAALRRSARVARWRRALYRGLITAMAFVGSLFGSFWAITSVWRSYFFDPRVMPLIALTLGLAAMSGCSSTITYGEMRRRELFHAMLVAWVVGLALMWRWWSRRRPGP
jgi:hypothetical protein